MRNDFYKFGAWRQWKGDKEHFLSSTVYIWCWRHFAGLQFVIRTFFMISIMLNYLSVNDSFHFLCSFFLLVCLFLWLIILWKSRLQPGHNYTDQQLVWQAVATIFTSKVSYEYHKVSKFFTSLSYPNNLMLSPRIETTIVWRNFDSDFLKIWSLNNDL